MLLVIKALAIFFAQGRASSLAKPSTCSDSASWIGTVAAVSRVTSMGYDVLTAPFAVEVVLELGRIVTRSVSASWSEGGTTALSVA